MKVKDLVNLWENHANDRLTAETYQIRLSVEDAGKLSALTEMYPRRSKEQILSELISAAFTELESSFPYIAGNKVVSIDELGDPIYEDIGATPIFLSLLKKYMSDKNTL